MRKYGLKILISIILISITVLSFVFLNSKNKTKEEININIKLIDINDAVLSDRNFKVKDKSLIEFLNENYTIRVKDSSYGLILYDIDDLKTDFKTSYISIYIDDKYSNKGLSLISLYDGICISFKEMKV